MFQYHKSFKVCFNITIKNTVILKEAQTPDFCHLPFSLCPSSKVPSKDTLQASGIRNTTQHFQTMYRDHSKQEKTPMKSTEMCGGESDSN